MTTEPTSNCTDSELEMQAMLYALGDPSLDREAFESLMESNTEALEAVSRAVWVIQGVMSSNAIHSTSQTSTSAVPPAVPPAGTQRSAWSQAAWASGVLALAASLVAFFSLKKTPSDSDFSSEWTAIASAWTDVQGSEARGLDPFAPRELSTGLLDSDDFTLVSANDSVSANGSDENESPDLEDIPSWLITAASRAHDATDGTLQ